MPLGDANRLGIQTGPQLALQRCPHCSTANPTITRRAHFSVQPGKQAYADQIGVSQSNGYLQWHVYTCESCGGLVAAGGAVAQVYATAAHCAQAQWLVPGVHVLSPDIPARAANYLNQARETLASPAASVLMSASAVDAMLKERSYKDGKLYSRIEKAEKDGVLTAHMADWAHDIRLDANDERHADENTADATPNDAARCLEFADALADLLFVLPARVKRGRGAQTHLASTGPAPAVSPGAQARPATSKGT